jgi:hypothetical protein
MSNSLMLEPTALLVVAMHIPRIALQCLGLAEQDLAEKGMGGAMIVAPI